MKVSTICFKSIGIVEKGIPKPSEAQKIESRYDFISVMRVFDEYVEGLSGLMDYSHIVVVYYMHEAREFKLKVRPWGIDRYPEVGIFATRFPSRPNPLGISVVELVIIEPPIIKVKGLDAWTGTPILDIKPYDYYDIVKKPKVPWWFEERWKELSLKRNYKSKVPWLGPCEDG